MLTNNNLRAFFIECLKAIFSVANTYNNPIIIAADIKIRVIEPIGGGNNNKLKTNVRIQNPTIIIFDRN